MHSSAKTGLPYNLPATSTRPPADGQAAARDAVKRRALEKGGIELVEIQVSYDARQSQMMVEHALERYEKHAGSAAAIRAAP